MHSRSKLQAFNSEFPSTAAMTRSPCSAIRELSTTSRSQSLIPASIIESPATLTKYVELGCPRCAKARLHVRKRLCLTIELANAVNLAEK